jgi:leucyl/phenylalanyl-tRNA--protein transferase
MPVFKLGKRILFPRPDLAEEDGLLAVGGDLTEERLLAAYSLGIFPWYSGQSPILWWSPNPRLVLFPSELRVSRSLKQSIRQCLFTVSMDKAFEEVIRNCAAASRGNEDGTWITAEMIDAYCSLHRSGYAHSVECWHKGELAGGLYGVSIGSIFFGESMFTRVSNASKVAFVTLVERLTQKGFSLIDCQMTTRHLMSLGAREVSRKKFMKLLDYALQSPTIRGAWNFDE